MSYYVYLAVLILFVAISLYEMFFEDDGDGDDNSGGQGE